ncbi:MAG: type II toxin-antitoxin system HicB family antitoxin [Methermicoccaceae archaeon]
MTSEEDEGYIAISPELAGCSAFGRTQEEALKELKTAMGLWLDVARRDGRELPKPCRKVAP